MMGTFKHPTPRHPAWAETGKDTEEEHLRWYACSLREQGDSEAEVAVRAPALLLRDYIDAEVLRALLSSVKNTAD